MKIFGKNLNQKNKTLVVAEIGLNHGGKISKAKKLVYLAKKAGVDAVKFQSYTLEKYCSTSEKKRYKMLKKFCFSKKQFLKIFSYCKKIKINYFSTAVTEDYVDFLSKNCGVIKIASGDLNFKPLLKKVAKSNSKIILSTGASSINEILESIKCIKKYSKINIKKKLAILHCVSSYPAPSNELNLDSINYLMDKTQLTVGYSNHSKNPLASIIALVLGAKIIEIHFTDNKKNRSLRDHELSFDYNDMKKFIDDKDSISKMRGVYKKKIQLSEIPNLKKIRKGIIASHKLEKFKIIKKTDLSFARPATNFNYYEMDKILGRKLKFNKKKGEVFFKKDI